MHLLYELRVPDCHCLRKMNVTNPVSSPVSILQVTILEVIRLSSIWSTAAAIKLVPPAVLDAVVLKSENYEM